MFKPGGQDDGTAYYPPVGRCINANINDIPQRVSRDEHSSGGLRRRTKCAGNILCDRVEPLLDPRVIKEDDHALCPWRDLPKLSGETSCHSGARRPPQTGSSDSLMRCRSERLVELIKDARRENVQLKIVLAQLSHLACTDRFKGCLLDLGAHI